MTETNIDLTIERLILDYYFDHASGNLQDILAHVESRVRVNDRSALRSKVLDRLQHCPFILQDDDSFFLNWYPHYSTSRYEWQRINDMDNVHVYNALQKMLREGTILQRRTEAKALLNKLRGEHE